MTRAKFTITVPELYGRSPNHDRAIREAQHTATKVSGGRTAVNGTGAWVSSKGKLHLEPVHEVSYLATESNYSAVEHAVKDIARAMLDAGEQAVLVQHWINGSFGFNLYTKENLQ